MECGDDGDGDDDYHIDDGDDDYHIDADDDDYHIDDGDDVSNDDVVDNRDGDDDGGDYDDHLYQVVQHLQQEEDKVVVGGVGD